MHSKFKCSIYVSVAARSIGKVHSRGVSTTFTTHASPRSPVESVVTRSELWSLDRQRSRITHLLDGQLNKEPSPRDAHKSGFFSEATTLLAAPNVTGTFGM